MSVTLMSTTVYLLDSKNVLKALSGPTTSDPIGATKAKNSSGRIIFGIMVLTGFTFTHIWINGESSLPNDGDRDMAQAIRSKLSIEQVRNGANELVQKNKELMDKWRSQSLEASGGTIKQQRDVEANYLGRKK
jgi:hypothetical protein